MKRTKDKTTVINFCRDFYEVAIGEKKENIPFRTKIISSIIFAICTSIILYKLWESSFIWTGIEYAYIVIKNHYTWYAEVSPNEFYHARTPLSQALIQIFNETPSDSLGLKSGVIFFCAFTIWKLAKTFIKSTITLFKSILDYLYENQ